MQFRAFVPTATGSSQGDIVATVTGPGRAILSGERVALNFLQRMSGIATATRRYVDAVAGARAVILDTRKTVLGCACWTSGRCGWAAAATTASGLSTWR